MGRVDHTPSFRVRPLAGAGQAGVLLALLFTAAPLFAQGTPGQYDAKIYRDDIGIGHVYGDTDNDVAYGLGRLIARDKALRTMVAMTAAVGKMASTIGPATVAFPHGWIFEDRKALAYRVPDRATSLWQWYFRVGATSEEIAIRELIVAYVEGIKDEIAAIGPANLASAYVTQAARTDWPYGDDLKLQSWQFQQFEWSRTSPSFTYSCRMGFPHLVQF